MKTKKKVKELEELFDRLNNKVNLTHDRVESAVECLDAVELSLNTVVDNIGRMDRVVSGTFQSRIIELEKKTTAIDEVAAEARRESVTTREWVLDVETRLGALAERVVGGRGKGLWEECLVLGEKVERLGSRVEAFGDLFRSVRSLESGLENAMERLRILEDGCVSEPLQPQENPDETEEKPTSE